MSDLISDFAATSNDLKSSRPRKPVQSRTRNILSVLTFLADSVRISMMPPEVVAMSKTNREEALFTLGPIAASKPVI